MKKLIAIIMIGTPIMITMPNMTTADEPTIVTCNFEKMPPMILTFRGGMGADDNTLQVGR
ncbi:hypothetical protein [Mesorhizobium sp. 1B3]|uniref:hypothetical protein n=1 Tax=Mesorhizobium sp. 1B3 TaxID=3243599 RepID=UPI003D95DB1D